MGILAQRSDSPEGIRAFSAYCDTFGQDIIDLATYDKVTALMQATLPNQGKGVVVDAGRCFVDEAPQAVIDGFTNFFD